jgi:hypothetical protein
VCLVGAWSVAFSESVPSVEPTIGDEGFVQAANDVCRPVQERLADGAARRRGDGSDEARAAAVSEVVSALDAMVTDLGTLRPAAADQREVEGWLGAWQGVLESGRATAAALREGDTASVEDAADAGQAPARAVNRFAQANGLRWCATRFG